jgi:hypothetical protein
MSDTYRRLCIVCKAVCVSDIMSDVSGSTLTEWWASRIVAVYKIVCPLKSALICPRFRPNQIITINKSILVQS